MAVPKKSDSKPISKATFESRVKYVLILLAFLSLVGLYYLYDKVLVSYFKWNQIHLHSQQDRLVFALRLQALPLLTLLISVINVGVARCRSSGAKNPLTAGSDHAIALPLKMNQNTIEQFLLHLGNQIILATYLPEDKLKLLPLLAIYFFVGRLTFMIGYSINHNYRSFGFIMTFIPTVGAVGYNFYWAATLGLTSKLSSPSILGRG